MGDSSVPTKMQERHNAIVALLDPNSAGNASTTNTVTWAANFRQVSWPASAHHR